MILQPVSGASLGASLFRWNVPLLGSKNGINTVFTTPEYFMQTSNLVIRVYRNGQRIDLTEDYAVSESGGAGTGYDTVTFNGEAPLSFEKLTADYIAAV